MSTNGNAAKKPEAKLTTIRDLLVSRQEALAQVLPKHLTPDRLVKVALNCIAKTPLLQECTPSSLLQCLITAAELGLEPGGALGHGYLVPYLDKKAGHFVAQFIIGYRGFIELMRRSGQLAQIEAHVVHEFDTFDLRYGLNPKLEHVPKLNGDAGKPLFVYCLARLKDGAVHVEAMSITDVEKIRARSRSKDNGPWATDFGEMARKTVVRRAAKYLPLSPELASAIERDDEDFIEGDVVRPQLHALPADTAIAQEVVSQKNEKAKEAIRARSKARPVDVRDGETEEQAIEREAKEAAAAAAAPPPPGEPPPPSDADAPF